MSQLDHESFLNIPVTRHSTQRDSENKGKRHGVEFQYNQGEVKSEPQVQSLVGISAHLNSQAELEFKNAQLLLAADEAELGRILLQSVLAKKPKHQPALLALAESLEKEGHLEEAIPYYSEGLKLKESGSAHLSLAKIYEKLGQYDEASNHFILGLEYPDLIKSELFEIYKSLGSISLRQQDYDAAEEYYNRAFTIKPHSDVLLVNYGTLEIQRASWNAAAYRFRSAVSINSENDKAWIGLALVHRHFGDFELSWANLERALNINPNCELARELLIEWFDKDRAFHVPSPFLSSILKYRRVLG